MCSVQQPSTLITTLKREHVENTNMVEYRHRQIKKSDELTTIVMLLLHRKFARSNISFHEVCLQQFIPLE